MADKIGPTISLTKADASLLLAIALQVYPEKINFKDATTCLQTHEPTLNENAVRARWHRVIKKLRADGVEIGEVIKSGEKTKVVKGPKNRVTKTTTAKKPRGKAVLKVAAKIEDQDDVKDVKGEDMDLDMKDEKLVVKEDSEED